MDTSKIGPITAAATAADAVREPPVGSAPTRLHLILLLVSATASPMAAVLISPVLPSIAAHFRTTPGVDLLTPLVLTAPFIAVAALSPFAGMIVDRVHRTRLLVICLIGYGVVGTMPVYLPSLTAIVISRIVLGPFEAVTITCATALISVLWTGAQRTRYLGVQILISAVGATVFTLLGGALGATSWRAPFLVYGVMIAVGIAVALLLPEPPRTGHAVAGRPPRLPARRLLAPVGIALLANVWFYLLIVQLPFVLTGRGVANPAVIGLAVAAMSLATAGGAVTVGRVAHRSPGALLAVEFALMGVGQLVVGLSPSVVVIVAGALVTGYGAGALLPTLLSWTMNRLDAPRRGRGSGLYYSALSVGQFASPLVVAGIAAIIGGRQPAIAVLGLTAAVVGAICWRALRGSGERLDTSLDAQAAAHPDLP